MTVAISFLIYLGLIATAVISAALVFLRGKARWFIAFGLPLWLGYVALVGYSGLLEYVPGRLPGILLIFVPLVLFIPLVLVRSKAALQVAIALPLWLLIGFQVMRVGVEYFLHLFNLQGLAPKMLTYEGANFDLWIGLSAPFVAAFVSRGKIGLRFAQVWNVLGLIALVNVIIRSVLTAPGPLQLLHTDVPNLFVGTFPYSMLPGFFPPLAICLHVLSLRAIRFQLRQTK